MLEAFLEGLVSLLVPGNLIYLFLGVLIGVFLGSTPGIGAVMGLSLALTILWGMEPSEGILLLLGIHASVMGAGVIPTILVGIPGAPTNLATLEDGYKMSKKGLASRAVGAGLFSSAFGGLLSVIFAMGMLYVIYPVVLAMGYAEMALLVLMGLCFLSVLGGDRDKVKNLMAGGIGILISIMGIQLATGIDRYTLGTHYFMDGFSLVLLFLGVFAMSEVFNIYLKNKETIAKAGDVNVSPREAVEGVKDVFRHKWLWLRCVVIGYIVGIIPGIGGTISIFVAYGFGKRYSDKPEKWGTGIIEGVLAPEAANNASVGGSLLTTLAFGIPGDSMMALVLGAFIMYGIVPGREMLEHELPFTFLLLSGAAIACLLASILILPLIPVLARTTQVSSKYLFSILLVLIMSSVYAEDLNIMDVLMLVPVGFIGLFMNKFGYSLSCFILGFILGGLFEDYTWLAYRVHGPLFAFSSPIAVALVLIILVILGYEPIRDFFMKRKQARQS